MKKNTFKIYINFNCFLFLKCYNLIKLNKEVHSMRKKNIEQEKYISNAMLKLKDIKKDYPVGGSGEPVHALKNIHLNFRKNEFVSILGPSGCGKTTLLNIIGGLDKYTSGDLIIAGKSTKKYNDRDWDVYRNHRIGFIFQSYNLIPHQTILGNVELALTIAGMPKKERIEKAKKALDKVGLKDAYYKHPNQLSGGQCQRVAIARALVNEPEILLADEPTGALDTVTSKQIMDLICEISKEKLVIMVTHNPEIAEQYSTRIIRLLDGEVVSDSNPFQDEWIENNDSIKVNEKAKMSFWTAFKLSFRNLISKFKRTILVCIAGSIGIVGVSTVLAVSAGVHNYIDSMQDDMLSGNPITINEVTYDLNNMLNEQSTFEKIEIVKENGFINVDSLVEYLIKRSSTMDNYKISNDITEDYIQYILNMPKENYAALALDYGVDITNNIYTDWKYSAEGEAKNMSVSAITKMYTSVLKKTEFDSYASYISQLNAALAQAPGNDEYILSQYDLLEGELAKNENEIMVVVNKNTQLTDVLLAQLGYYTQNEFINIIYKATDNENYNEANDKYKFAYQEILNKTFTWYPNDVVFTQNSGPMAEVNPFTYSAYVNDTFKDGLELKVTGILQPKENISYGCLDAGFYYTEALTKKIIQSNIESEIVKYYQSKNTDTITSGPYIYPATGQTIPMGVTYTYDYIYEGETFENEIGYLGSESGMSSFMSFIQSIIGSGNTDTQTEYYSITIRQLGGNDLANNIAIYPIDFDSKYKVTEYLDKWNQDGDILLQDKVIHKEDRSNVTYTDNLEIVIRLINTMIDIITYALIVFTALSLLVSTVMIGIITYVSVVERVKEIGVIRSLGGRKRDVSYLFNAETFIIGLASGIFGILFTLGISGIINLIVGHFSGIYTIAALPFSNALIMIIISILLTLISGLIPAKAAAKKNPVEALRTE